MGQQEFQVVQSDYYNEIWKAWPGMTRGGASNRISRTVQVGQISFGQAAWEGTVDQTVTSDPASGRFVGWMISDHGKPTMQIGASDSGEAERGDTVALMPSGSICVTAAGAVNDGDQVYARADGFVSNSSANGAKIVHDWFFDEKVAMGLVWISSLD